ncbi:MAG: DUF3800 domain-containing protein, partial [Actinomycetota bacterium]
MFRRRKLHFCYVDESGSGDPMTPVSPPDAAPVLVVGGVILDQARLVALTRDFLALKQRFFPRL